MRENHRQPARSSLPLLVASGVFVASAAPTPASASDCAPQNGLSTCIDADNLWLRPGTGPFFAVGSTVTSPTAKASFGLVTSYLSRPVGLRVDSPDPDGTVVHVLDDIVDTTFLLALGVTDRLEVTAAAPVTLYQNGAGFSDILGTNEEIVRSAVRDPRIGVTFAILPPPRTGPADGLSLVSRFELGVPFGDDDAFAGAATVTGVPSVTAHYQVGRYCIGLEAGARLRGSSTLAGTKIGSQLQAAVGGAVDVLPRRWLTVAAEAFALYTLSEPPEGGTAVVPAEWIVSARTAPLLGGDVSLSLGGGGSIPLTAEAPLTSPRYRFDLALRYAPTGRDADADGVLDRDDACLETKEDRDGFKDDDGCPDPDNDGDRVPDRNDNCRDEPETLDGFKDDDGCPDSDDDADAVSDEVDRCRNEPEDRDGYQDGDGCPDPDNDADGIEDKLDRCPRGAEDRDGFKDDDGCPEPDNDADQTLDASDQCPGAAEDRDGFKDDDGCPDPDNDEDGVADLADRCPTAPETIDGTSDDDGCPEPGGRSLPQWSGDRVTLDGLARFAPGSAKAPPALAAQARMMAQLVRGRAPIDVVIVEAYPDRQGAQSARAIELAGERASAVKALLAAEGIPADRITAAAGDTTAKRAVGAPQIEITVTRARNNGIAPVAPKAATTTGGEKQP